MLATSELEKELIQDGGIEDEDYYMVCFLCDEDCLESMCIDFMSEEQFCTIDEDSLPCGSHGRVNFEIKAGFIYLQDNPTAVLQLPCFDMENMHKYKWEY